MIISLFIADVVLNRGAGVS